MDGTNGKMFGSRLSTRNQYFHMQLNSHQSLYVLSCDLFSSIRLEVLEFRIVKQNSSGGEDMVKAS